MHPRIRSSVAVSCACLLLLVSLALSACAGSSSSAKPTPEATGTPTAQPTPVPTASDTQTALPATSGSALPTEGPSQSLAPVKGLYVRMWDFNPSTGPAGAFFFTSIAISDGKLYYTPDPPDGSPAPIYVGPVVRTITSHGLDVVGNALRNDGLLGKTTDFECPAPSDTDSGPVGGWGYVKLQIVAEGIQYNLRGSCPYGDYSAPSMPVAGSYSAFDDFTTHLANMEGWLGDDLGPAKAWTPEKLVVDAEAPDDAWWEPEVDQHDTVAWVAGTFDHFGVCGELTGTNLTKQLPAIKAAHEGTVFVDSAGQKRVLAIHVLMPNEPATGLCGGS